VATSLGGISRIDDPAAIVPKFFTYTIDTGLSSNVAVRIAEDLMGRIYAGGGRGVDQIDPTTGRIRHYTTADGLVSGEINSAFTDRSGAVWFGTLRGLSRMIPKPERQSPPAPIWISGLRVAGERQSVSALGESAVVLPDLSADRNQLEIEFVGVSFAGGERLRYQYRLEGSRHEWSAPSDQRTVHLAALAPGKYTFEVRALNSDREVSPTPARVTFTILAPVWQRPWFAALGMLVVGVLLYGAYRYRVSRLLELERVRTRIASDLHDDIGAALSRIAVLSEVARLEAGGDTGPVPARLSVIASASREVLDSMNDIVWAINPRRDQVRDLIQRMRRFASDIFTARAIAFAFRAPQDDRSVPVTADVRRHIFLVFKEAVNNIVRHSGATQADVDIRVDGNWMTLTVCDNGRGFDPARRGEGHGLVSMHDRARMMGGRLEVTAQRGGGTMLRLTAPLNVAIKEHNRRLRRSEANEGPEHGAAT
jgi:signal transduction histidine kinase